MEFGSRLLRSSTAFALFGAVVMGCAGDVAGDKPGRWQCYDGFPSEEECLCRIISEGQNWTIDGTDVTKVDACEDHPVCVRFFDTTLERPSCACGPNGFMPEDAKDVEEVDDCPPS